MYLGRRTQWKNWIFGDFKTSSTAELVLRLLLHRTVSGENGSLDLNQSSKSFNCFLVDCIVFKANLHLSLTICCAKPIESSPWFGYTCCIHCWREVSHKFLNSWFNLYFVDELVLYPEVLFSVAMLSRIENMSVVCMNRQKNNDKWRKSPHQVYYVYQ